jgi:hypothetical protein
MSAAGPAPVTVVNTTTNPVPITGVAENPARQAAQQDLLFTFTNGNKGTVQAIPIPAHKIFVLEFVSFSASLPANGVLREILIVTNGPKINGSRGRVAYQLAIPPPNAISTNETIINGGQEVRLYAQPTTDLEVSVQLGQSNSNVRVALSGYFVNAQ